MAQRGARVGGARPPAEALRGMVPRSTGWAPAARPAGAAGSSREAAPGGVVLRAAWARSSSISRFCRAISACCCWMMLSCSRRPPRASPPRSAPPGQALRARPRAARARAALAPGQRAVRRPPRAACPNPAPPPPRLRGGVCRRISARKGKGGRRAGRRAGAKGRAGGGACTRCCRGRGGLRRGLCARRARLRGRGVPQQGLYGRIELALVILARLCRLRRSAVLWRSLHVALRRAHRDIGRRRARQRQCRHDPTPVGSERSDAP